MGLVNPFFEKAGMQSYKANMPLRSIRLIEALRSVGILPPAQRVRPAERSRVSRASPQGVRGTCPRTEGGTPSTPGGAAEEDRCLISPRKVHDAIGRLDEDAGKFIEREIALFLQSYGRRRRMPQGLDRSMYFLS